MIYTRFGSPVSVTKVLDDNWVQIRRIDGTTREAFVGDLKADRGAIEIMTAIDQVRHAQDITDLATR